jgi:WD40 repeat protein
MAWSPDGRWIAVGESSGDSYLGGSTSTGSIAAVDAETGEVNWRVPEWGLNTVVISPNGRRLAVASETGTAIPLFGGRPDLRGRIRMLDAESGAEVWQLTDRQARELVFSPDGRLLAINDGSVRLVDPETGSEHLNLGPSSSFRLAPAFSSDSRWLAAADPNRAMIVNTRTGAERWAVPTPSRVARFTFDEGDRQLVAVCSPVAQPGLPPNPTVTVLVIDVETGAVQTNALLEGPPKPVMFFGFTSIVWSAAFALSPDRRLLANAGSWEMGVFGVADGRRRFELRPANVATDPRVQFSPGGRMVAVNSAESVSGVTLVDAETGAKVLDQADEVGDIAFSPDGGRLAVCGKRGAGAGFVRVYDTGVERSRRIHGGPVSRVAATADGMRLVATASGKLASVFHADSGDLLLERPHPGVLTSIVFSPDGGQFVTGSTDGVRLFQTVSGAVVWKLEHGAVNAVAVSPGAGQWVVTASNDRNARLVRRDNGQERWKRRHLRGVSRIAFSADARWVATGAGRVTRILDAADGADLHPPFEHDGNVQALAFSPVGSLLATANQDGMVLVIDASTGEQPRSIPHPQAVVAVAFSPDGSLLATGGADRVVRVFQLAEALAEGPPMLVHQRAYGLPVTLLAFQPVGGGLAIATEDPVVRIIDPADGIEVCRFVHPASVHDIAFSANGELIATACDDAFARVFSGR